MCNIFSLVILGFERLYSLAPCVRARILPQLVSVEIREEVYTCRAGRRYLMQQSTNFRTQERIAQAHG